MRSLAYKPMPAGNTNVKYAIRPVRRRRPLWCFLPRMARPEVTLRWR